MLIWYVRWLDIEIRYINIECFVKDKHSLMLTFNVDWFQAFSIGWINSGGARYFIVNSLPLNQRYKSGNVVLVGVMQGNKETQQTPNQPLHGTIGGRACKTLHRCASISINARGWIEERNAHAGESCQCFSLCSKYAPKTKSNPKKASATICIPLPVVRCPRSVSSADGRMWHPGGKQGLWCTSAKSSFPAHQSHPLKPDFSGSTEQEPSTSRPHTRKRITHWMPTYGKMPAPLPHISHCICACISNKRRSGPPAVQWLCLANFLHCLFLELYPSRPHTGWYQEPAITAGLIRDMLWTLLQVMEQHNPCTRHYQSAGQYLQNIQLTNSRLSYMREFPPSRHHRRKWC